MASQESVARLSVDNRPIEIEEEDPDISYHTPQQAGRGRHGATMQTSPAEATAYLVEHIHDNVQKEERYVEISRGLRVDEGVGTYALKEGQEAHSYVGPGARMKNPLRKPFPPHTDSVCPMNAAVKRQLEEGGDTSALEVPPCEDDRDVFTTDVEVPRLLYKVVPKYVDIPVKVQKIVPRRRIVKKVVKR